ncbi:putative RNA-binding protein 27, partial [Triplophysa rosa]
RVQALTGSLLLCVGRVPVHSDEAVVQNGGDGPPCLIIGSVLVHWLQVSPEH